MTDEKRIDLVSTALHDELDRQQIYTANWDEALSQLEIDGIVDMRALARAVCEALKGAV